MTDKKETKITFRWPDETIVFRTDGSQPAVFPSSVSPSMKLVVEEVPKDAMSDNPRERYRITSEGAFLTRGADGRVYNILGFEEDDNDD